jgi:hypothetical protein
MKIITCAVSLFLPLLARAADVPHTVEYKMDNYTTVFHVLTPAGATCHVKSDNASWMPGEDFEVPFKFEAQAGHYHTFDCKLADGRAWRQRLDPKANHTTVVRIDAGGAAAPTAAAPQAQPAQEKKVAMSKDDFAKLVASLKKEAFDDNRLKVVGLSAKNNFFSAEQIGTLIDAFPHGSDKTKALQLVAKRLVDAKNSHTILSHFTFDSDKETAEQILSAK